MEFHRFWNWTSQFDFWIMPYEDNLWNQNFGNMLIRFSNKKMILKSVSYKVRNNLVFHGKALHPNTKYTLNTKKNHVFIIGEGG